MKPLFYALLIILFIKVLVHVDDRILDSYLNEAYDRGYEQGVLKCVQ
jgi:hypothetical protein